MRSRRLAGTGNRFIDAFPPDGAEALLADASIVELEAEQLLYTPGGRFKTVYFPIDSRIAIVHVMDDGTLGEYNSVGRYGMTGARTLLGLERAVGTSIVSIPGSAYRAPLETFLAVTERFPDVRARVLRYNGAVMTGIGILAVCNSSHTAEQRVARWLLLAQHGVGRDRLPITHAFLGRLLGMLRPAVSARLAALAKAGAIELGRGDILIKSSSKLKARSCECFGLMAKELLAPTK